MLTLPIPGPMRTRVDIYLLIFNLKVTKAKPWNKATVGRDPGKMSSVSFSSIFTNNGRSLGAPVSLLRTLASTHASCDRNIYKSNVVLSFSSSNRNFVCESWKRHVFTHTDTAATAAATTPSSYGYSRNPFSFFFPIFATKLSSCSLKIRRLLGLIKICKLLTCSLFGCWESWGKERKKKGWNLMPTLKFCLLLFSNGCVWIQPFFFALFWKIFFFLLIWSPTFCWWVLNKL